MILLSVLSKLRISSIAVLPKLQQTFFLIVHNLMIVILRGWGLGFVGLCVEWVLGHTDGQFFIELIHLYNESNCPTCKGSHQIIIMGNEMCCSLEYTTNKFRGDLFLADAFESVQGSNIDPVLQKLMADHKSNPDTASESENTSEKQLMKLKSGDIYYYCSWVDSVADGKGIVYKPNVLLADLYFKKGFPEGKANIKFISDDCEYEGQVRGWTAQGHGTLRNNASKYEIAGEWDSSHLKNCKIMFQEDKNVETVQIVDYLSREGVIKYRDKRHYEGSIDVKKLVPHGQGKLTFPDTSLKHYYLGEWYKGQMCGKGKFAYRNKSFYEGDFFDGQREGYGHFTYENGDYFEGYWHKGRQLGVGALYTIMGEVKKYGMWDDGRLKQEISKSKWAQLSEVEKSKNNSLLEQDKFQQASFSEIRITQSKIEYENTTAKN